MSLQQQLLEVYFTPTPYYIYKQANATGNMAYAGIGLGLINTQKIFWIANCGTVFIIYYPNTLFLLFLAYLYYHSFSKTLYLLDLGFRPQHSIP